MAKYRSELRIPVELDKTSFADRIATNYNNSQFYHRRYPDESHSEPATKCLSDRSTLSQPWNRIMLNNLNSSNDFSDSDIWFEDVKRRFDERRQRWDEEVQKMRNDMFTLSPSKEHNPSIPEVTPCSSSGGRRLLGRPFSSNIERRADGSKYFVTNFDVSAFPPESISVSVRDDELIVGAKIEQRVYGNLRTREFTRTLNLSNGADASKLIATLSSDHVLTITCPMKPVTQRLSTAPMTDSDHSNVSDVESSKGSSPRFSEKDEIKLTPNNYGSTTHSNPSGRLVSFSSKPKFSLELPIDPEYSPAEIRIRTLNNRIYINARHEERGGNRTAVREFAKEYDIPEDVNPEDLQAKFDSGILYIDTYP